MSLQRQQVSCKTTVLFLGRRQCAVWWWLASGGSVAEVCAGSAVWEV